MMPVPRLRELRTRAIISQADLAQKSGVAEATINRLELGVRSARFVTVRKLADALGVAPGELTRHTSPTAVSESAISGRAADR